jgi:hypothetical protein
MSGGKKGNTGASMGGVEVSRERRKRDAKKRKRQEERWAAKSGPVTVYRDPSVVKTKPDAPAES